MIEINKEDKQEILGIVNDHNYETTIARLMFDALYYKDAEYNESVARLITALKENKNQNAIIKQPILPMLLSILAMMLSILSMAILFLN